MADESLQQQLRRALSYRLKVERLERESEDALRKDRVDQERYEALREFYIAHKEKSERALQDVRRRIQSRLVALDDESAAIAERQTELGQRVAAGQTPADAANRTNRDFLAQLAAKQDERTRLLAVVSANDPAQAGGFIDMPLEEYARAARLRSPAALRSARALAFFVPFVAASMVFLPWVAIHDTPYSLRTLGATIPAGSAPFAPAYALVWLVYFIIPLLSLCFTALSHNRRAGRGVMAMGFAAIAAVILGVFALPAIAPIPGLTLAGVLTGLGAGALGYLVGALALLFIGRARIGEDSRERVPFGLPYAFGATAAMALIGVLGVVAVFAGGAVSATASFVNPSQGLIEVAYSNASPASATVHVPWPGAPGGGLANRFGVSVLVREEGGNEFRLLPQSEACWTYPSPPGPGNALEIPPRRSGEAIFDARQLSQLGIRPAAVRLVMTNSFGETLGAYDFTLPADLPPPPAQQRSLPEARAAQTNPPPAVSAAPMPSAEPAAPPRPAEEPAAPRAVYSVRIAGVLPNPDDPAVVIEVTSPDGRRERVTVREGDAVVEGWMVREMRGRDGVVLERTRGAGVVELAPRAEVELTVP